MKILFTLFFMAFSLFPGAFCEDEQPSLTNDDIKKMPIKRLKHFLTERGLECRGCAEKDDYVKMVYENRDAPLAPIPEEPVPTPPSNEELEASRARKKKDMEELMAGFKGSGLNMGNMRMFTGADFAGLSKEEMEEKMRGMGGDTKYSKTLNKGKKSNRKENKQKRRKDNEGENIEL